MVNGIDPQVMAQIKRHVRELAARDYPKAWVGQVGMTADQLLREQEINLEMRKLGWEQLSPEERAKLWAEIPEDYREGMEVPPAAWEKLPEPVREGLRAPLEVEPGEFVGVEGGDGMGIQMPGPSVDWIDGLWAIETLRDELPEGVEAELHCQVLHVYAAKRGEVVLKYDCREFYEADIPPILWRVRVEDFTADNLLCLDMEELDLYAREVEPMGPFVIPDTLRARAAIEERLQG
jgi:hypothetical protein